jgi:hypothetical protein
VRLFSTACDSASITSIVSNWRPFNFIFNREQRIEGWAGDDSHVLGQKFTVGKGSERRCVVVMQQPFVLSPKFGGKYSHIFTQSTCNVTVVCGIDCLDCQDKFFVSNPLGCQMKWWACSWFCCLPVSPFSVLAMFGLFHWEDCCYVPGS